MHTNIADFTQLVQSNKNIYILTKTKARLKDGGTTTILFLSFLFPIL